jgi:hypothetical protein
MTCSEFLAQLGDMLDGHTGAVLRADLEAHLVRCEHCVITLNTTRKTIEIYRNHQIYELPDDLRDRLEKAIMAKCRKGC